MKLNLSQKVCWVLGFSLLGGVSCLGSQHNSRDRFMEDVRQRLGELRVCIEHLENNDSYLNELSNILNRYRTNADQRAGHAVRLTFNTVTQAFSAREGQILAPLMGIVVSSYLDITPQNALQMLRTCSFLPHD